MHILVSGSTGFIGSALKSFLVKEGHDVTRLVRRELATDDRQVRWDPVAGVIDSQGLAGIDAAVHLAGEPITGRWTATRKTRIRDSRVKGTRLLSETLARLDPPPQVLVCASAMGYYGDRGAEVLRENSAPGTDFLAGMISEWEAATERAVEAGIRVVNLRLGMVLGKVGGALKKMLLPFKLGVGGSVGSGRQYVSWISLEDVVRAIHHVLNTDSLQGPLNVAAPGVVTNAELTRALGRVLSRPAVMPVPGLLLRILYGEVAETLLFSARMDPGQLQSSGFVFRHPEIEGALRAALGKS